MKTIVVVGAGKGLGYHIAERFGKEEFQVYLIARRKEILAELDAELKANNITSHYITADAASHESICGALEQVYSEAGEIDVLAYNVGITTWDKDTVINRETIMTRYEVDVIGAYDCITYIREKHHTEVTVLLTGGKLATQPNAAFLPLSMDKSALRAFTHAMYPVLKDENIYLGMVSVMGGIAEGTSRSPEKIADTFWKLYHSHDVIEMEHK